MQKLDLKNTKPDKSKLVKNLARGNILAPYLDKAFQTFDGPLSFEYSSKIGDDAWHPSGDCTPVVSSLFAKATGDHQREDISSSLRKAFMVGHYWHQLLQHIVVEVLGMADASSIEREGIRGWGMWKGKEVDAYADLKFAPYHWVHGSADITPFEHKTFKGIVDFKTMSSHQFKQQQIPEWAADKYKCQMNIYMDLFDQDQALILAVNKDGPHDFKEFTFNRDQPLIDAIYEKWKYVGALVDSDTEPEQVDDDTFTLPL